MLETIRPVLHVGHISGSFPVMQCQTSNAGRPSYCGRYAGFSINVKHSSSFVLMLQMAIKPKYLILQNPQGNTYCRKRRINSSASRVIGFGQPAGFVIFETEANFILFCFAGRILFGFDCCAPIDLRVQTCD